MPYSIPSSTKIFIYFGNSTIFVLIGALSVCEFAMVRGAYILLCPQKESYILLPTYSAAQSSKRFKPLSVNIFLWQGQSWRSRLDGIQVKAGWNLKQN